MRFAAKLGGSGLLVLALVAPAGAEEIQIAAAATQDGEEQETTQTEETPDVAAYPPPPAASQVVYVPPSRGAARVRTGGGTRGPVSAPTLAVLAPDHVGVTNQEEPSFAWFVSAPTDGRIDFTLVDPQAALPLLEVTLPSPDDAGIQLVHLADHHVRLEQGRSYDWSVALVVDPDNRDLDVVASGAIRREPAAPEVGVEIAAGTPAYVALARAGVWYDALADLSSAIEANPGDAALRAQRAALLEQVGVGAAAAYEKETGAHDRTGSR